MVLKKIAFVSLLSIITLPLLANATEVNIVNNTSFHGTGKISFLCSSVAGDKGVVKPHSTFSFDLGSLDMVCSSATCDAEIYMTKDCSGKTMAKVTLDKKKGVTNINNFDPKHFKATGGGTNVTIDEISAVPANMMKYLD